MATSSEEGRITLRGTDLPLGSVLGQIARSAHLALVFDKDVKADRVVQSANLDDLTLETALAVILTPMGYSWSTDKASGELRVFVNETKTFRVAVPALSQTWNTAITNEGSSGGGGGGGAAAPPAGGASSGGLGARVSLGTRSDSTGIWGEIETSLGRLVGSDGVYSVNRVAGFATVRTLPSVMTAVTAYFDALNAEMGRSIVLETRVIQVDFRDRKAAGIDWATVGKALGSGVNLDIGVPRQSFISDASAVLHLSGALGDAFLRALQEQGDLHLVAQPTLVLGNNLPAIIDVGQVQSFVASQTTTVAGTTGTTLVTVQTESLSDGLILSVLPRLMESGDVTLALGLVAQDILEIRRESFGPGGSNFVELPKTSRRAYNGVVRTKIGDSLVIGGLISDRKETRRNGIPFLSSIPIIGWLFGAHEVKVVRSELVVTITPRALTPAMPLPPLEKHPE